MSTEYSTLLNKYFLGIATNEEFAELEELIRNDPEARREYIEYAGMDTAMRSIALEGKETSRPKKGQKVKTKESPPRRPKNKNRFTILFLTAAAAAAFAVFFYLKIPKSSGIIHFSDAKWESAQPTAVGSELFPGTYRLKSGSSTVKLHSGADLTLKGPVKFEIVSDMQINVQNGSLSVFVRDSAKGFRIDTPNGYAVDHGTRFSVNVSQDNSARFMVSEGEISLHHNSGEEKNLTSGQGSLMTAKSMNLILGTNGDEITVIEDPRQIGKGAEDKKFLMVKRGSKFRNSRISFFAFKLTSDQTVESARMVLNYVPAGITNSGDRNTMPEESEFVIHGIPDGYIEKWKRSGMKWAEVPILKTLPLLDSFKISRDTHSKRIIITSDELTQFLKQDKNGELSFVIACKTVGGTMIHAFASSKHEDIEGPTLEIFYSK